MTRRLAWWALKLLVRAASWAFMHSMNALASLANWSARTWAEELYLRDRNALQEKQRIERERLTKKIQEAVHVAQARASIVVPPKPRSTELN